MVLVLQRNDKFGQSEPSHRPNEGTTTDSAVRARICSRRILAGLRLGLSPRKIFEVINLGQVLDFVGAGEGHCGCRESAGRFLNLRVSRFDRCQRCDSCVGLWLPATFGALWSKPLKCREVFPESVRG